MGILQAVEVTALDTGFLQAMKVARKTQRTFPLAVETRRVSLSQLGVEAEFLWAVDMDPRRAVL